MYKRLESIDYYLCEKQRLYSQEAQHATRSSSRKNEDRGKVKITAASLD